MSPDQQHVLRGEQGFSVTLCPRGARITSIRAPDRSGVLAEVTLGPADPALPTDRAYLGALVGRYANRIAHASFVLDGRRLSLVANESPHHLHGGSCALSSVTWGVREVSPRALALHHRSPDGDQGYPGTLELEVTYRVAGLALCIEYRATTDRPTVLNLSNHTYFDLSGDAGAHTIVDHLLQIDASRFVAVDAALLPTGELRAVAGTPFDFRTPTAIGARIDDDDEQLTHGKGYDHCWVIDQADGRLRRAAILTEARSGRRMEVESTEPGLQLYSGNVLDAAGPGGVQYRPRAGLCLETQHLPDSPNRPEFPSTVLRPGEVYSSTTVYTFSAAA